MMLYINKNSYLYDTMNTFNVDLQFEIISMHFYRRISFNLA